MSTIQEVLDSQKLIEENLFSKMAEFERQLQPTTSSSKPNIDKLEDEFYDFKKLVLSMFAVLNKQINALAMHVDVLDNQQRRNALLFNGIQESDQEDCTTTVLNIITSNLNIKEVCAKSILVCHRLGTRSENRIRPIIVRFTNIHVRDTVWAAKKLLKSTSLVLCEFLTKTRQAIFIRARKHFGVTRCWSKDGNILVKLPDNVRKRITSAEYLEKLIYKYPSTSNNSGANSNITATALNSKGTSSVKPSAVIEPPVTRRNAAAKGKIIKN